MMMFITTGMKSEICPGNLEIRSTGVRDVLPLNWCKLKVLQVAPQKKSAYMIMKVQSLWCLLTWKNFIKLECLICKNSHKAKPDLLTKRTNFLV